VTSQPHRSPCLFMRQKDPKTEFEGDEQGVCSGVKLALDVAQAVVGFEEEEHGRRNTPEKG
jgi:hypothetical protein